MAHIDLNNYRRVIRPIVKEWLAAKKNQPILTLISEIALATNCPIIAVSHYVLELGGPNQEVLEFAERMKSFYHIDNVIGYDDNEIGHNDNVIGEYKNES